MGPATAQLSDRETELLQQLDGPPVRALFDTASRVDVGGWLGGGRLRVAVTEAELVLFAAGSRPFLQRTPLAALRESLYNHVTGELILAPAEQVAVRCVRIAPVPGRQLLAAIKGE